MRTLSLGALACAALLACGGSDGPSGPPPASAGCGNTDITLAVGERALPRDGSAGCRLAPQAGAEYALAYVDTRAITRAETAPEPFDGSSLWPDYQVRVTVEDATLAPPPSPSLAMAASLRATGTSSGGGAPARPAGERAEGSPFERTTPWVLDERFDLDDPYTGTVRPARVVRIYAGDIVVAHFEGDRLDRLPRTLALLDSAVPRVLATAVPLLRESLVSATPRTSRGSGQYLVALRADDVPGPFASTDAGAVDGEVFSRVVLTMVPYTSSASIGSTLAHEMTHSYQLLHSPGTPASGLVQGRARWGFEGVADLLSVEFVRREADVGFTANFDWRQVPPTATYASWYARRAQPMGGEFTGGYDAAAGFLRDLVSRRLRAGDDLPTALREVARGATEGWRVYQGATPAPLASGGLIGRMRARLGDAWDPADALLTWTLSHAADDRTASTTWQNPSFLRLGEAPPDQPGAWHADAEVNGAASPRAAAVATATRPYGSPGFMLLRDGGRGVRFTVESATSGVRWAVLRIR